MIKPQKSVIFTSFLKLHMWEIALGIITLAYFLLFSRISLVRHWSLGTYYYDLGIMHQVVYNTSQGLFLQMTDPNSTQQFSRFAIHFDPLMIIFVPFYKLFPYAETLLIGQTFVLAVGAIPVFLLTKHALKKFSNIHVSFIAFLFSFMYLNYFPLQKTNIFDFHAVVLVTSLFLWAFYFIETGRYKVAILILVLSLFGKENIALTVFMIGLYITIVKKERILGLGLSAFCTAFFLFTVGVIIPSNRTDLHFAESYYSKDILTNLQRLFSKDTFDYIANLLKPLGFGSLFSPLYLALAAPEWAINILSGSNNMKDLQYHYTALLTPFIFLSAINGLRWIIDKIQYSKKNFNIYIPIAAVITLMFTLNIYTSWQSKTIPRKDNIDVKKLAVVRKLVKSIGSESSVAASGHLGPYFSGRQYYYNFLFDFAYGNIFSDEDMKKRVNRYEEADYVVIQKSEMENDHPLVKFYYNHLKMNTKYEKVFDREGIEVYRKYTSQKISLENI